MKIPRRGWFDGALLPTVNPVLIVKPENVL